MTTKQSTNGARVFNPSFFPLHHGRVKNPCSVLCAFILGATLCHAQNHVIYYGANSNTLGVAFADTTLSVSNQTLIVADINQCLQSDWGKKTEFYLRNNDNPWQNPQGFVAYLSYPNGSLFYEPFPDDIAASPSGQALHISKDLSDAYTYYFNFFATNSNIVATGHEFVAFLNSTNFPALQASDWPNYFFSRYETDAEIIASANGLLASFTNSTYFTPSILNFQPVKYPKNLEIDCFYMVIPNSRNSSSYFGRTPAIYHDGRWKIMDIQWFIDPNRPRYEVDDEDE